MKIAVCFSGQPRTWEKCHKSWASLFAEILKKFPDAEIDTFMHAWDANSHPHNILAALDPDGFLTEAGDAVSSSELDSLVSTLKPKSVLIEDGSLSTQKILDTLTLSKRHDEYQGVPVMSWAAPQFYSVMRAAHLKKQYEYDNNFRYDLCIRLRYDLFFDDAQTKWFVDFDLTRPVPNTVYACHTSSDSSCFPLFRLGDILWFADSVTFDRICDFYRWFPLIGEKSFRTIHVSTEHALYWYIKMLRMKVRPLCVDPKIYRMESHLDTKQMAGLLPELGNHELI